MRHGWRRNANGVWQCAKCALVRWVEGLDNGRRYREAAPAIFAAYDAARAASLAGRA